MVSTMNARSTKGASKQRRENINGEISMIRELLPIQEQVRNRLSQLQVMSLCKAYIGKSNSLLTLQNSLPEEFHPFDFTLALPGFLIVSDLKGRILYISDNVTDYLAHSMVDVITQAETIYELVHTSDQQIFKTIFSYGDHSSLAEESTFTFTCRMGMLKHPRRNPAFDRYKKMRIFGRKTVAFSDSTKRSYFVALCTPRLNPVIASDPSFVFDTMIFKSSHGLDMKYIDLDHNGRHHLGYSSEEISSKSWYEMIHPSDINMAVKKHKELIQQDALEASISMSIRMQSKTGQMLCVQLIMRKESNLEVCPEPRIVCWNQVVCPNEMSMDDKEELMHQMNTINYLEHYCSTQSSDRKILFNGKNETTDGKVKKCDRSELMEKLKRKMQRPETRKTKTMRIESVGKSSEGATANAFDNIATSASVDLSDLLPDNSLFEQDTNFILGQQFDIQNFTLSNGPTAMPVDQLVQSGQPAQGSSPGSLITNDEHNKYHFCNFATEVVTMPTPERRQTWSPIPAQNYLATSPVGDDLNNQSFFSMDGFENQLKHGEAYQGYENKRSAFPELKPQEVDEFFEMEATANLLAGIKNETGDPSSFIFDQLDSSPMLSEQFTQIFLQHLSALAY